MRSYDQYCGLARALDHVGHRWTLLVVRELLLGPKRFSDLRDALPGIASNLLTDRLRHLEADGLVARRELPPPAARTVYELTPAGRDLEEAVHALVRWGGRWMLRGPEGDTFRAPWLALALDALGVGDRLAGVVLDLVTADERVRLTSRDGRVVALAPDDAPADATLTAEPATILGLAAGAVEPAQARRSIEAEPSGEDAERLVLRVLRAE
ncbi:MAG: winged helix-turn-helix transcriptional regulator [Xanthomonadales bacterium]|nr:winged helix-turn-helix transcriptional regulator [Xanthomonadales bacterium]